MEKTILNNIPNKPWIYLFKDSKENVLYIWKAKNLKKRVSQYFNPNSVWKQDMLNKSNSIDFLQVKTESEALYLEDNLIKEHQPPYNNMLKWSNSYAYIKITKEDFPEIFITRFKKKDGSKYIWPKHNTKELKNFLQHLRYILKRRWCKKTQFNQWKLCSDYHFGLCEWRCTIKMGKGVLNQKLDSSQQSHSEWQLVIQKSKKDYTEIIKLIEQFFLWNIKPVEKEIKQQIKIAVENQNFERAAKLRDIYMQIESLSEKQTVVLPTNISWYFCQAEEISNRLVYIVVHFYEWKIIDVLINKQRSEDLDQDWLKSLLELEFYQNLLKEKTKSKTFIFSENIKFNKKQKQEILDLIKWFLDSYLISQSFKDENLINDLLLDLQNKYKLKNFPYHMECVDISHLSGSFTSWWLSWFVGWIPNYKIYRRYKVDNSNNKNSWDDYSALREIVVKRFKNKEYFPDLFVIDGWKWQLWILKDLLKEDRFQIVFSKVDFISIWKWQARNSWKKIKWEKEKIFFFDSNYQIKSADLNYDQTDNLLIKLRDESHRFANSYRKKQMKFKK